MLNMGHFIYTFIY
jgi:hypothetical protein